MGLYGVKNDLMPNKPQTIILNPWSSITLENPVYLSVQSHSKDQDDFVQGSTVNISECNNKLELSVCNMCCSHMVLTNPHMKPWNQIFIIMKIFMKTVKISSVQSNPGLICYQRSWNCAICNQLLWIGSG